MSDLLRLDPFFSAFDPLLPRRLGLVATHRNGKGRGFSPSFEVRETASEYRLTADMPGVPESALDLSVDGRELTVKGTREFAELSEGESLHVHERTFGAFSRTFALPDVADTSAIEARLADGVLTLRVPKRAEAQPRKISVSSAPKA